jgi:UDP-glucose 4-epimerase
MQRVFVTGAAGFIGSNLVDRLLADGRQVVGWDNFSTGQRAFLAGALARPHFRLVEGDNLDLPALTQAMAGCDFVFHLAANADVRRGTERPRRDLEQNTLATWNVLEAARLNGVAGFAFASTGSVYGEPDLHPTPEGAPFPVQTSLYGASKLAGEGLVQAYAEGFGLRGLIFRFVSILGERYTHGHVFDFHEQLLEHPAWLRVLGDGRQRKSYLHVADCVEAMLTAVARAEGKVNVFNLGTDEYCEVNDSVAWICAALGLTPRVEHTGGRRGWVGDSPFIFLDTRKVRALGWRPRHTIRESVVATVRYLDANRCVYGARAA